MKGKREQAKSAPKPRATCPFQELTDSTSAATGLIHLLQQMNEHQVESPDTESCGILNVSWMVSERLWKANDAVHSAFLDTSRELEALKKARGT
jgi:hypothetical protein